MLMRFVAFLVALVLAAILFNSGTLGFGSLKLPSFPDLEPKRVDVQRQYSPRQVQIQTVTPDELNRIPCDMVTCTKQNGFDWAATYAIESIRMCEARNREFYLGCSEYARRQQRLSTGQTHMAE